MKWIFIGLGGCIGAILRFYLQGLLQGILSSAFPLGTLAVNLSGSLIIGCLGGLFENTLPSSHLRLFLMAGVLGGFTTFSSFSLENLNLLRMNQFRLAFVNIFLSNALGLFLAFGGYMLFRQDIKP